MKSISIALLDHKTINSMIRSSEPEILLEDTAGQRFIGAGMHAHHIMIRGVPGNALGAYLNGGSIEVMGNAQDAVGDTMNAGDIIVHGNIGDAAGYAMRGGSIYVQGNAGYRAGIHMKAYKDKKPVLVIGGCTGSFLGEYQAGGIIIVLGLHADGRKIVGNFPCTGMHAGKMFLRSDCSDILFPGQVTAKAASASDMEELAPYLRRYCTLFHEDPSLLLQSSYTVITPDSKNPYQQMYIPN